jgi:hypothetical protein
MPLLIKKYEGNYQNIRRDQLSKMLVAIMDSDLYPFEGFQLPVPMPYKASFTFFSIFARRRLTTVSGR